MNEATQSTGVSNDDDAGTAGQPSMQEGPLARRNDRMSQIHEKRKEEYRLGQESSVDDRYVAGIDGPGEPGEAAAPPAEIPSATAAEQRSAPGEGQPEAATPGEKPATRTLKVNGKIVELTEEQVERMLQQDLAGQARLDEAAALKKTLEDREAALEERERALQEQNQPPSAGVGEQKDALKEALEHLLDGDVDQAAELLSATVAGRSDGSTQSDALVDKAAARVLKTLSENDFEKEMRTGWQDFEEGYPEIATDDALLASTDVIIKRLQGEHPEWGPRQLMMKAGEEVKSLYIKRDTNEPPADQDEERLRRKESLIPIPQGHGSARREVQEEAPLDTSPSGVIDRMKRGRAVVS